MGEFDKIKHRIKKFTRSSIIDSCLQILANVQKDKRKDYPFWVLLVLIKWAFVYTKNSQFRMKATVQDVVHTLMLIERFESDLKVIDFKLGIRRGLRIIAYQQFWFQDHINNDDFERQLVLYIQLKSSFDIDLEFKKKTNLSIEDFIKIVHFTFIYLNMDRFGKSDYDGVLHNDYWDLLIERFTPEKAKDFSNLLTIKNESDIQYLQKMNHEAYQLYETNFWHLKPFFLFNKQFMILHRAIFNQTAKNFVYDFMKKMIPQEFSREFGSRMERYVELGLIEIGKPFSNETKLKQNFPQLGKSVDFMTEDNLLIECKAIELHPRAGILRKPEILLNEFQDSIIKSYKQLLSTANTINKSISWFGVVITYKDTYIGFGSDAWSEFLKDPISEFLDANKTSLSTLPPENLCFITIQDWDHIVQVAKDKKISIKEILLKAFSDFQSKDPNDQIMLFEQALQKHFPIQAFTLSYLQRVRDQLIN